MELVKNCVKSWMITVKTSKHIPAFCRVVDVASKDVSHSTTLFLSFSLSLFLSLSLSWYHSFGQTLFSRFIKEMIIATDANHDGKISMNEMRNMLKNIGVDKFLSQEDLDAVFQEIGHLENGEYLIYVDEIESILTSGSK